MLENRAGQPQQEQYSPETLTPKQRAFLENDYLRNKYLIPDGLKKSLRETTDVLDKTFPEFLGVALIGSTINGSFLFRKLTQPELVTDADFLLIGHQTTKGTLKQMAEIVQKAIIEAGFKIDSNRFNGSHLQSYIDIDRIDQLKGIPSFLALPFGCVFGTQSEIKKAQIAVLQWLITTYPGQENRQFCWRQICDSYSVNLMITHRNWTGELNRFLGLNYSRKKIEMFALPETPEEMLQKILSSC